MGRPLNSEETKKAEAIISRLQEILQDEKQNVLEAIPVAEKDIRLDTLHRGDHSFHPLMEMLHEKIKLTDRQIDVEIPLLKKRFETIHL
jgi:hypothetical protein